MTLADGMLTELTNGSDDGFGTDDFLFGGSDTKLDSDDLFGSSDVGSSVSSVTDEAMTDVVPVVVSEKEKTVVVSEKEKTVATELEVKRSKAEDALAMDLGDGFEDDWLL